MTPTHPTAEEIAREAAHQYANIVAPNGSDAGDWLRIVDLLQPIILTSARRIAAQMVRDSGAVEALEGTTIFYAEDMPQGPEKADLYCVTQAYRDAYASVLAAIAKLRAITQQP